MSATLVALLAFLSQCSYMPDVVEDWQSAEEFAASRAGDCEDFAEYACQQLRAAGYAACLVSSFDEEGRAHTVCLFAEAPNQWSVLNGPRYQRLRLPFRQAAARVAPQAVLQVVSQRDSVTRRGYAVVVLQGGLDDDR